MGRISKWNYLYFVRLSVEGGQRASCNVSGHFSLFWYLTNGKYYVIVEIAQQRADKQGDTMNDYSKMTHDDEARILGDIMIEVGRSIIQEPGVFEFLRESYNNEILSRWEQEQDKS